MFSSFYFQPSIIFIDSEGMPVQELSAIEMCLATRSVVDVFHAYHFTPCPDSYSRKNVHGLDPNYLKEHGHITQSGLIREFRAWLDKKNYIRIYGNDPRHEVTLLKMPITNIGLPNWADRIDEDYHTIAKCFKNLEIPICGTRCPRVAHCQYNRAISVKNETEVARNKHGFHCSLNDCYELYLYFIARENRNRFIY